MPPTTRPVVTADDRRAALRRMRLLALSLLLGAAVVFVLTLEQDGWLGFLNAGAEAAMVGAVADWFAVTALFRHPLGLPIPHTALVPRRKDELGRGLEDFVGENFLAEDVVRERLHGVAPAARVGEWLADDAHVRWLTDEGAVLASAALRRVRDDHVEALVTEALLPRLREEAVAPLLGGLLEEVLRDDTHRGLVDLALAELHEWLLANPAIVYDVLEERAPSWAPAALNRAVTTRAHRELVRWVSDIRFDPEHRARAAMDDLLARLAHDLLTDPATQERTERLKERVLEHPAVVATAVSVWEALRRALTSSLADDDGAVQRRVHDELGRLGARLRDDAELRERVDRVVADAVVFVVDRYGRELTAVISQTIARWDGQEAAERIELHVGRDLQFIRINGTVVGFLVGVLIHTLVVVLH